MAFLLLAAWFLVVGHGPFGWWVTYSHGTPVGAQPINIPSAFGPVAGGVTALLGVAALVGGGLLVSGRLQSLIPGAP